MSIASTANKVTYQGNGATTVWPFSFAVLEKAHLQVIMTDAAGGETTLTSDYTVDLVNKRVTYPGYESGAEPPIEQQPPILPTGKYITLLRVVPYTQESDLGDRWPFTTVEASLDKLTMEVQQLAEESSRSVKTGVAATVTPDELLTEIRTGASTAVEAANTATSAAGTATAAAGTATAAATIASADATAAIGAASAASTSATTATEAASTANTKAAEAVLSANSSNSAATAAGTAANTATAQAVTATTKATEAASSAAAAAISANIATANAGYLALPNHIVRGGKVASVSGLTMTHDFVEALINRKKTYKAAGDIQALPAKRLGLFTIDEAGNRGTVLAADPTTFIDNNTVGLWEPNGGASCPNLAVGVSSIAVSNNFTMSGTSPVDGMWGNDAAQGDGSTSSCTSANYTGFPLGATERAVEFAYTCGAIGSFRQIFWYGTSGSTAGFLGAVSEAGEFVVWNIATILYTGFTLEQGKTYEFSVNYDGTNVLVYINGSLTCKGALTCNTAAGNLVLFTKVNTTYLTGNGIIHYIEVRNKMRTAQEIAEKAAKMCVPVCWTATDGTRKSITATFPDDTISLGMVRTSASGVLAYNDADWGYGRREKAYGGNRRVFLDWQSFSGAFTGANAKTWSNPFKSDNVTVTLMAKNAAGAIAPVVSEYLNTSWFGARVDGPIRDIIRAVSLGGKPAYINGTAITSGYIGAWIECLEVD